MHTIPKLEYKRNTYCAQTNKQNLHLNNSLAWQVLDHALNVEEAYEYYLINTITITTLDNVVPEKYPGESDIKDYK